MAEKKNRDESAKLRILNAAREVFAEKGYDAASIAEIADHAKVNKALPYYYFESKQKILEELINRDLQEVKDWRLEFARTARYPIYKSAVEDYYVQILDIFTRKREIFKILMLEAMKGSSNSKELFERLDPALEGLASQLEAIGVPVENKEALMTYSLFMSALPIILFAVLGDQWAEYKGYDREETKNRFLDAFKKIYINYNHEFFFGKSGNK
jgi:AcrR family transcriptional regulator